MISRRVFIASSALTASRHIRGRTSGHTGTRHGPELYFYPNAYQLCNGTIMYHPMAVDLPACTTCFPLIAEMAGVVAISYWSQLSREPGEIDLALLRQTADYWKTLGRRVVIGVVTVGYPLRVSPTKVAGATPDWVMARIATYEQEVQILGGVRPLEQDKAAFRFASYWDGSFIAAVEQLVTALGRAFDGDPAISRVRISTGITGEDNPTFDGLRSAMPGFSNMAWIAYCDTMLGLYVRSFRRTQLEFDIDRLGWIAATGTPGEQAAASALVNKLLRLNVFLAMDGFDTKNAVDWRDRRNTGPERSIDFLALARGKSMLFGLEGGSANGLSGGDALVQADIFCQIGASRLVLFSDGAAALNLARHGHSAVTAAHETLLGIPKLQATAEVMQSLLNGLGMG